MKMLSVAEKNEINHADIGTCASLANLRLIMAGENPSYVTIERHFFGRLLESLVSSIFVDEEWYLLKYPDIKSSITQGILKSGKEHYVRFGYFEHRMPYQIPIDNDWYLMQYPDVRAAVRREDFASGQIHFEEIGFREGRLPFANFSLRHA